MSDSKSSASGAIGFCGLLTIAFIVLKLCHVIAWNWWWVLSPLWIPAGLIIFFGGPYLLFVFGGYKRRRRKAKQNLGHGYTPKSKWQQRIEYLESKRQKQ